MRTIKLKLEVQIWIDDGGEIPQGGEGAATDDLSTPHDQPVVASERAGAENIEGPRRPRKRWTAAEDEWLKALHKKGYTQIRIAQVMGRDRRTIRRHMRRLGLPTSRWWPSRS
jgi:hypothetical protein